MTLDEAIEHLNHLINNNAFSCEECKQEHIQLLNWLIELKELKESEKKMYEYIERGTFIELLKETKNDCERYADKVVCDFAIKMAKLMPTADVQEVRHGKWELIDECANEGVYCSNCHKKVYRAEYANQKIKSNYCPNCGAKMDKE